MDLETDFVFTERDSTNDVSSQPKSNWKILIADDEDDVRAITTMVLSNLEYDNRKITILNASSATEARNILKEHNNIAAAFIDVVMEHDNAGLELVRWIRQDLDNSAIRLILRTGQPGYAPENTVIYEYDINDYQEKTEISSHRLQTTVISALRSYERIRILEKGSRGLQKILTSSGTLFDFQSVNSFAEGVLEQMTALLKLEEPSLYVQSSGLAVEHQNGTMQILAGTGEYEGTSGKNLHEIANAEIVSMIKSCALKKKSFFSGDSVVVYFQTRHGSENILYLSGRRTLDKVEKSLIRLFSRHIAVAFDNIHLNQEIEQAQLEILYTLSEIVETRSRETGHHVRRVAETTRILASQILNDPQEVELIAHAAALHDVGKIAIADNILLKEGRLDMKEFEAVTAHTTLGYDILKDSKRPILETAARIALEHHEYWNGGGYPCGLKKTEIFLPARIVCIADVFDALVNRRVYKDPWTIAKAMAYITEKRGIMFDPEITDLFFANKKAIIEIQNTFLDE